MQTMYGELSTIQIVIGITEPRKSKFIIVEGVEAIDFMVIDIAEDMV